MGGWAGEEREGDLGDAKEVADPDSQRRGGGLALQAGGLPARHSMNGSACVCAQMENVCAERDAEERDGGELNVFTGRGRERRWK